MEPGRSQGRPSMPVVYVNTFGSHRCGSIVRYGTGCPQAEASQAEPLLSQSRPLGESRRQSTASEPGNQGSPELLAAGSRQRAVGSCGVVRPVSRRHGDLQGAKADTFEFPFPSRKVDKVIKRKKQKSKVWLKVWKVMSKMIEENEEFRSRLLTCSQLNGEGNDMSQSSQNEACYLDEESSIFGWV